MNPRRKRRLTMVSIILVTLAAATGLVLYALSQNIDLFYTPTELVEGKGAAQVKPEVGQRLRVGGLVVPGSVERIDDGLTIAFDLIDEGPAQITVEYTGILPDLFREGQGIVAQGELISATRIRASEVLAKHDEEYMPPELAKALKGIEHVPPANRQQEESDNGSGGYQ
ncbi:cytochrome c maturation protein CcmE [Aliidiomarina soli]|uniref:Cytochrome c-type biogenesis protein CcmE n=1 Tax=Aliidiomarina soli TaxID=1928574 RepID=A0A432WCY9_9GAMM|nr:cytochrome c maturation protein CcmE [Aliidiomarina soli]RUO30265.1 cytochrome c maturation protein CcmE [Aliidiomarina soli]